MATVVAMHDYFRNLWPNDPYILTCGSSHFERIEAALVRSMEFLQSALAIGSYLDNPKVTSTVSWRTKPDAVRYETEGVYQELWSRLPDQRITDDAAAVLEAVFQQNGESVALFRGKRVLDMGCGSGRFSFAFANLGAGHVIGVDLGKASVDRARRLAQQKGIRNLDFVCGSVLDLPFADHIFDFVWCKGVLHHTGNLMRGLDEYLRVMKPSGAGYLYLYGDGGLFWTSRRRMREVMRLIPLDYAVRVLELIGMPPERYIFVDSWYVPIEEHVRRDWLEAEFCRRRIGAFSRADDRGRATVGNLCGTSEDQWLWGDGDLRYFIRK